MTEAELRELPLFAGVSEPGLAQLAASAGEVEAQPGQVLALADDPGSGMFVILAGRVSIELPGGRRELGEGDFFGELALLVPDSTRIARVRAAEPVRLLALPRADALELIETEPALAFAMLREVARRLVGVSTA
jgi:voltage-gated potassium channel